MAWCARTRPSRTTRSYSALFNYKNDEGTFGVMVQGFSQKRELRREAQEIPRLLQDRRNDPVARPIRPDRRQRSGLLGSTLFEQTRERKGGLVSLQFKPRTASPRPEWFQLRS
jgi:iron complex outermembrane receptor protein